MPSWLSILVFIVASLHHGLAKELYHCGKMQRTALGDLLRCGNYVNHFGAYCHSPLGYQALFSRLPDELQIDMWQHWKINGYHLGKVLFSKNYEDSERIAKSAGWSLSAADNQHEVCWHLDFYTHVDYNSSPLGIVNNLLFNPSTKGRDMPRHILDLPPVPISTKDPLCFASTTSQYEWLRRQIKWMTIQEGGKEYHPMDKLIVDYKTWTGTIGQAMAPMLRANYKCPRQMTCKDNYNCPRMTCEAEPAKGKPFLPTSYTHFLDALKPILARQDEICFALRNELPAWAQVSEAYWFIPGAD